ncbi:MAG: hypothetical protein HGB11_00585 [Chlorobiales bacterium]|nr:hypothetical protein [Chlorobiales bacterium]
MPTVRKCERCEFWEFAEVNEDGYEDFNWGFCKRFPPSLLPEDEGDFEQFPRTYGSSWCGEFKTKEVYLP